MVLFNQPLKLLTFFSIGVDYLLMPIIADCSNNRPDYEYGRLFGKLY